MAINYREVLSDLREQRRKLDIAIQAIQELVGDSGPEDDEGFPHVQSREFADSTVYEAARTVLRRFGHPLSTSEIARILQLGGYPSESQNFYNTVYGTLSREMERGEIVKDGSKWALRKVDPTSPDVPDYHQFADLLPSSEEGPR